MDYTVQQLIHNQSFRRMVKGTADEDEMSRWDRWIKASGEHRRKAKKATAEIEGFEFRDPDFPDLDTKWNQLKRKTTAKASGDLPLSHYAHKGNRLKWLPRVAAVVILIGLIGIGFYVYSGTGQALTSVEGIVQSKTIKTGPNQQTTITFSSGAKIIVNNRSKLTYRISELHSEPIKVHLQGEAFFEATEGSSEFVVYTPDGIVRDIGTKFLVAVKKDHSRVVVQAGKVEINMENKTDGGSKITAVKGEMLSFNNTRILSKKKVNPTYYTSWATGYMHFHHTSLQKFARYVEKRFNVNVKIVDPRLESIKLSGNIYVKSLADLMRFVSKVVRISVQRSNNGKIIYLESKHYGKVSSYE